MMFRAGALLFLLVSSSCGFPQDVTTGDIESAASNAGRYGSDSGTGVDPGIIAEVFDTGSNNDDHSDITDDDTHLNAGYEPPLEDNHIVDTKSHNCSDYYEDGFRCVPYYLCDDLGTIITDGGPGLIDVRGAFGVEIELDHDNSKCEGFLDVCCRLEGYDDPVFEKTTTTPAPPKYVSRCGQRNTGGIGVRIQNIDKYEASTQFGEWPHMCAVLEDSDNKNLYVCGASLIAPGVAMTAAHCVEKYQNKKLKVRCGEWDTQKTLEPVPHQDRDVYHITMHPEFNSKNLANDIALLHVEEEFILSDHVDVICLPNLDQLDQSYEWEDCWATGWGKDQFDPSGQYQVVLKQVGLNMVGHNQCENLLRKTRLTDFFRLDQTFICAGGVSGVDTCKGDGGGPLVCPVRFKDDGSNNYGISERAPATPTYVQSAIVAWGIGCAEDGVPGVYTDVAQQLCFIKWATECQHGASASDHYGIDGCIGWFEEHEARIRSERDALRSRVQSLRGRPKKRANRKLKATNRILKKYQEARLSCISDDLVEGPYDGNDSEEIDISGYQRNNAKIVDEKAVVDDGDDDDDHDDEAGTDDAVQRR